MDQTPCSISLLKIGPIDHRRNAEPTYQKSLLSLRQWMSEGGLEAARHLFFAPGNCLAYPAGQEWIVNQKGGHHESHAVIRDHYGCHSDCRIPVQCVGGGVNLLCHNGKGTALLRQANRKTLQSECACVGKDRLQ